MEEGLDLNLGLQTAIREDSGSRIQLQTQMQQIPSTMQQSQSHTQQSHAQKLREEVARRGETRDTLTGEKAPRLERSPHPYHKRHEEIPFGSERSERNPVIRNSKGEEWTSRVPARKPSSLNPSFNLRPSNSQTRTSSSGAPASPSPLRSAQNTDDELYNGVRVTIDGSSNGYIESTNSDSGTEADDEHFLKGLPAPRTKPHKGLRGVDGSMSSTPSPLLSPAILDDEIRWKESGRIRSTMPTSKIVTKEEQRKLIEKFKQRRRIEIVRRTTEACLLCFVGGIIYQSQGVKEILYLWKNALYPLRLLRHLSSRTPWKSPFPLTIPATFDPAPLLYPPTITMLVSILLSVSDPSGLLPSMILAISTLPKKLIPAIGGLEGRDMLHWVLACMPLFTTTLTRAPFLSKESLPLNPEVLVLIPPLHQALCKTLYYLTTTSLLAAELQLLSTALISLLLRASSPQAVILKALLWGGGIGILVTCTHVLRWGVTLARVPTWKFRRPDPKNSGFRFSKRSLSFGTNTLSVFAKDRFISDTSDDELHSRYSQERGGKLHSSEFSPLDGEYSGISRRNTLPGSSPSKLKTRTPSGRKKRSASISLQSFSKLTYRQATFRKWGYAIYVYICILVIVLLGIREYVGKEALQGYEPVGWALGYMFGDLPRFRLEVVKANLQRWIPLPSRSHSSDDLELHERTKICLERGWVERIRTQDFGAANTRLILLGYWLLIIIAGLAIVFRLSKIYEVDTRRKVFHFMMVFILLPSTFVDPNYCALAMALVLGVFLLLDLLRASQLPPISRALAKFLMPYVDGRDLKGPVVVSHIFLGVGCAVPLWLSLGSLPSYSSSSMELLDSVSGSEIASSKFLSSSSFEGGAEGEAMDPWKGWEIPQRQREIAMVAGVICVGLGDAAASLVGRRCGKRKWYWGGGKSLEGSMAFMIVVAVALVGAKGWVRGGGWEREGSDAWSVTVGKSIVAAGVASLTEAVLTGGNDNVVVPVVLWCCVKGLGI
ncbi:hypothetical protein BofuT4_P073090.1 [Botrytis cinerea T4]|uniref:dolichol kinase n=1 Tax=Botryotinia fuckeliana (strain T4) TaxID=999810 RepID=G2XP91_BOTF4|nr:hypothetical protein BofuT4_P073090.1 [Botrytis cinerea T4]